MSSLIFSKILEEKIEFFKHSFKQTSKNIFDDEETKRLIHPGEFGNYREQICKSFLRLIIPMRLDMGSGFIITDKGDVSTQIDIIIYDRNNTPLIENAENQRFYPVETVAGIVEVKSNLRKDDFIVAINKLARNKKLKERMSSPSNLNGSQQYNPKDPSDSIFSVLICNKLDFKLDDLCQELDGYYESDIKDWEKHNLILSVEDGLIGYYEYNKFLMYPYFKNKHLKSRFVRPNTNPNSHFLAASSYIFMGTSSSNIFYPEISDYIKDSFKGGVRIDQK